AERTDRDPRDAGLKQARMKAIAQRAVELDPDLPDANLALALATDDAAAAAALLRHAIDVDPSYAPALRALAALLRGTDSARAAEYARLADAIGPASKP